MRSRWQFDILSLPGRHWKWRMHGAAITLARKVLESDVRYDAFVASDMIDLSVFLSLIRHRYPKIPTAIYFHENQLLYPWSPRDGDAKKGRDLHYAFINYASALAADRVFFNSDFHRKAFIEALPEFLERYPDFENSKTVSEIASKSETLWLGMDLQAFDTHRPDATPRNPDRPLIVWNHRWEYDKNPIGFFRILYRVADLGFDFDIALLGERFEEEPPYFIEAKRRFEGRIVQYGRVENFSDYARWMWNSDIALVTSNQDFFGGSAVEAIYCGCHPILPNRLAYRDHIDPKSYPDCYYDNDDEAVERLAELLTGKRYASQSNLRDLVARYDWSHQAEAYDSSLESLVRST